ISAEKFVRLNRQFLLEKGARCRNALFLSLRKIRQSEIVMNPGIARVHLDGLLEFTDGLVQIPCLAVRAAQQNVELRGRSHVVQYLVEEQLRFSHLVQAEVGEPQ